jgi:hypothetical protein
MVDSRSIFDHMIYHFVATRMEAYLCVSWTIVPFNIPCAIADGTNDT